ncbi:autotransporter outer membrane beta-barrel domain-containing protein [Zhongshania aquimaris]|uniref:Autotransporter outer membrane beta-barrel domain-containing protein n=1 Tax=Zhongshania aquimaris TaxID=2857107 RepID=A0ABS6VNU0_9GAMM|nr:autotransporter outer membrane beta-barrel domain-containing protein [Zhongshania aquimaris]
MKTYSINKAVSSALAISCGLLLLPSAVLAEASDVECNSKVVSRDDNPGEYTPPTGGVGNGEFSAAAASSSTPRVAENTSVETPYYPETGYPEYYDEFDPCGATVSESAGTQAQEVAMTIGSKIISQRNMSGKKSNKTAFDYRALGGAAGADDADNAMLNGSRFSLFSFADYSNRDRHATSKSGGYEQEINSITLGFDYRLDDATFLGLSLSGSDGDSDLDTQNGGSEVSSTTFGVHGAKYWGDNFVAGLIAYGALDVDVARTTVGDSFTASTDGSYWYGDFSLGMEKNYGGLRVTPQARLLLLSGELDAYRETSASGFGVIRSIDSQDIDSTTLTLSVQGDYPILQEWGVLLPSLRVELIATDGDAYTANGQNLNDSDKSAISSFANEADDPDSSTVLVSWGASAQFSGGFAAYAVYERLFYHDYLNKYTATVGLRYELP